MRIKQSKVEVWLSRVAMALHVTWRENLGKRNAERSG